MTEEKLILRTLRYNRQAADNLPAYRLKVIALFHLGLAFTLLFCLPFFALLLFAIERCTQHMLFGSILSVISLLILSRIIRPLSASFHDRPDSIPLDAKQSPELFAMVQDAAAKLGLSSQVRINLNKHLAINGQSGKKHTVLNVGLPLMQTLTREQFESVLLNELIHVRNGNQRLQSTMSLRIKRWTHLRDSLEGSLFLGPLCAPFFQYILPWLDLHTYPLYCQNVLQNDAETARLCPPETLACALCNLYTAASYLESDFWQQLTEQSRSHKQPVQMPFSAYPGCLKPAKLQSHLDNTLSMPAYIYNTSPTLQHRLNNLRLPARLDFPRQGQAASALLGSALAKAQRQFDQEWWQGSIRSSWQHAYDTHQNHLNRLKELDALAAHGTLSASDALERALLTEAAAGDTESALRQFAVLYRRDPGCAGTNLEYGRLLLDRHDGDGVPLVRRAAALDSSLAVEAATLERDYHERFGRHDAAAYCQATLNRLAAQAEAAQAERTYCTPDDQIAPACLPAEDSADFYAYLDTVPDLDEVYLVRKIVQYHTDQPVYIIAFTVKQRLLGRTAAIRRATERLSSSPFPREAFIISLDKEFAGMKRRLQKTPGARIR